MEIADHDADTWLSDGELCERYVAEEREAIRMQARAAATLAEIDRRVAFEPEFLTSTAFVRDRLGVSGGEARRRVAEARGLADPEGQPRPGSHDRNPAGAAARRAGSTRSTPRPLWAALCGPESGGERLPLGQRAAMSPEVGADGPAASLATVPRTPRDW